MVRLLFIWLFCGALALGLSTAMATRRGVALHWVWYIAGLALGPIYLAFVFPIWVGQLKSR